MWIVADAEAQGARSPVSGVCDADAWGADDLFVRYTSGSFEHQDRTRTKIDGVEIAIDGEGLAEFGGAGAEVEVAEWLCAWLSAVGVHEVEAFDGFESTDEHSMWLIFGERGDIHAEMHAIGEVDVTGSWGHEHWLIARGAAVVVGM